MRRLLRPSAAAIVLLGGIPAAAAAGLLTGSPWPMLGISGATGITAGILYEHRREPIFGPTRGERRLPGSLCDETPQTLVADGPSSKPWPEAIDRSTCARCGTAIYLVPTDDRGMRWDHGANVLDGHEPVLPTLLPQEPNEDVADGILENLRVDELTGWHDRTVHPPAPAGPSVIQLDNRTAVYTPDPAALGRRSAAQLAEEVLELQGLLAEVTGERDEEARINEDLRKTIAGLRRRVHGLELTVRAYANRATSTPTPQDHGDDLVAPWPAPTT